MKQINQIANCLKTGGIVALPTETVYGLAVSLKSEQGINKLINLKDRPLDSDKIFTLVPESVADIKKYAIIPDAAKPLIRQFFPGPLTLILPKNPDFSHPYFKNLNSVGLRIPDYPLIKELLPVSGAFFLTSANPKGWAPATDADDVWSYFPDLDLVIEGIGGGRKPSTIVNFLGERPQITRMGALSPEQLHL